MSYQQAAEASKEAEHKLSQCSHALSAMIQSYVAGNGHGNGELVLVASDGHRISVDRNLATSFSKYFEASSSSGMKEAAERIIRMEDIDSKVLRSIIVYLTVGPLDCDKIVIPLPKLTPKEAFQLMSVSTRLLMPDVCSKIAHDIDQIADLDVEFYLSAQDHVQTSGPDYQSAWSTASDKALKAISQNIEKSASDPLFSKLRIGVLHQVIEKISDLPKCWMDQDDVSSGFRLKITEKDNSISAFVYLTEDNPFALCLGAVSGGLYHIGVRLEKSENGAHKEFQVVAHSKHFISWRSGWGWPSFITKEQWKQLNVCPPYRFSFFAYMSILHRKCFALLRFVNATFQGEGNDRLKFSGSMLVKSLQYFNSTEGEPAKKCFAVLLDCAALSFHDIKAEESLMTADASILCALLGKDSLYIDNEEAVLKFVAQWAMKQQEIEEASRSEATSTASMDGLPEEDDASCTDVGSRGIGQGDASYDDEVTSTGGPLEGPSAGLILNIEKVLKLVRFPFIPFANMSSSGSLLTRAEKDFLKAVPCFSGLVKEAANLQISKASNPVTPAQDPRNMGGYNFGRNWNIGQTGQNSNISGLTVLTVPRAFYKDTQIPALDMSALL